MGTNFASSELEAISWKKNPTMHILIKINPIRKKFRRALRKTGRVRHNQIETVGAIEINIDAATNDFKTKSYAYIENALTNKFHEALASQFPTRKFFDPFYDLTKTYDWGFVWNKGKSDPDFLDQFPALKALYDYVRTKEFCKKITEMCGDGVERECYSIDSTYAKRGAYLTPHQDAVVDDKRGSSFVNCILFVTGNGDPSTCGGTSFSSDAEMKRLLMIPTSLHNSMVMYRSQENIWHGFRRIGKNQSRKAVIFQYCSTQY